MDFFWFVFLSYVKIFVLLLSGILGGYSSPGQVTKRGSLPCSCTNTAFARYPDVEEEDELEGTVIVEYEIDSICFACNPKIIQSLGEAYDKEALRATNVMISFHNRCLLKCRLSVCEKRKIKFPLTFKKPD
jgi:hypothetical protein